MHKAEIVFTVSGNAGPHAGSAGGVKAERRWRVFSGAVILVALLSGRSGATEAADPWLPSGIVPATVTTDAVFAKVRAAQGHPGDAYARRVEHYSIVQAGRTFTADAFVRDGDFVVRSSLAGNSYASGSAGPMHWRQTPRGLVRLVDSDVQGDDLDRWPAAILGMPDADCRIVGQTQGAAPAWVLRLQRAQDIPHFVYVDETTGTPVREITREGVRIETTTFDDVRSIAGVRRPMHWTVRGPGSALDVTVTGIDLRDVDAKVVAIPGSTSDTFPIADRAASLDAKFTAHEQILVPVEIDGRAARFILDTGTPQVDIALGVARRFHVQSTLGHAIARRFSVAGASAAAVPIDAMKFDWYDGILGYDFFCGRIVHVDYRNHRVESLPRGGFAPPAGAGALPTNYDEGMPIVAARVGSVDEERFVLDTGSFNLVLTRHNDGDRDSSKALGLRPTGRGQHMEFLEGPIETKLGVLDSFLLGNARLVNVPAYVETGRNDTYFPIDGIIGNSVLRLFEWWFDADGATTWYRFQG